ncbi:GGDEF domain-containing protein, partial [bacterium]|nr:GGDEF domain-containing protein [bacterium]
HPAGNEVLTTIARLLKANIRKNDTAARYGGEEFSVVLVETDKDAANLVAHKIKSLVEAYAFANEENQPAGKLTISVGVATYPDDFQNLDELVKCADRRLYKAKKNGRNLVVAE